MKKLIILVLIGGVIGWAWYTFSLSAAGSGPAKIVNIESGSSVTSIAEKLEAEGLIRSAFAFKIHARLSGNQSGLKAGTYSIRPDLSADDIIAMLTSGEGGEVTITIPEGFTIEQIDALMAEKGLGKPGDIMHCAFTCDFATYEFLPDANVAAEAKGYGSKLEGYVFPDTYFISGAEYVPKFFLERTLNAFRQKVMSGLSDELAASNASLHEIVTMASLIEEETITDDERPVVSGILWKRYNAQIGLGVDATVRYFLRKPTGALTRSDLDGESDYNTRKYRGLPPGPIASPGLASIKASLSPESSPYFYYLHDNKGQIHYAVTNEEHNQNKAIYLQ